MARVSISSSYVTKFAIATSLVVLAILAAAANLFANLSPELAQAQQEELVSGLVAMLFILVAGVSFVAASVGREAISSLNALRDSARRMERGELDVDLETHRNDEIGELTRSFAATRDALKSRISQTEQRSTELQEAATDYSIEMQRVGEGDLTRRLNEDVAVEEMAELAENFNQMMDQLEETVGEVYAFTEQVAEATSKLETQTDQSIEASEQVYSAAQDMDEQVGEGEFAFDEGELASGTEGDMSDEVDETVEAIERLSNRMDRVNEILEFISEVADETNMLALNAGIEASKVEGEGAEGFQVIAEEVKTLAEETRDATDEIETISDEIREGTNNALNSVLRQQAMLVALMDEDTTDLADSAEELRRTLTQLEVSDLPEGAEPVATSD